VHQHRLAVDHLESSFAQKYLRILLDIKLTVGQERANLMALKANSLLGCLKQSVASRLREVPPMKASLEYGEFCLAQVGSLGGLQPWWPRLTGRSQLCTDA